MGGLNFQELISAFIVLFAVIDIIGAVPIILDLKQKGRAVNAWQATLIATALLVGFFFAGDMMLKLFQVDIASFAVAGAFVIFLMSLEMILDIEIFKNTGPIKEATRPCGTLVGERRHLHHPQVLRHHPACDIGPLVYGEHYFAHRAVPLILIEHRDTEAQRNKYRTLCLCVSVFNFIFRKPILFNTVSLSGRFVRCALARG